MKRAGSWAFGFAVTLIVLGLTSFLFVPLLESPRHPDPVTSAKNLGEIGDSLRQYASDNGGFYPDDFSTLYLNENIAPVVFVYPGRSETPAEADTRAQNAAELSDPRHCSYVYLGKGLKLPVDEQRAIALERMGDDDSEANVLFGDGRVVQETREDALKAMKDPMALKDANSGP
jgi:prepilin-type processing-associated H-X9-DG protein